MNVDQLRAAGLLPFSLLFLLATACSGDDPTGGPVSGPLDAHCAGQAQPIDLTTCHATVPPAEPDYGPTLYNSEADDDDCKYHLKFTSSPVRRNEDITFTVTATTLADGEPAAGADVLAEVFLSDTHPAPNSGQATSEKPGGIYEVGPVRFDASGRWTVRFHLHDDCQDSTEDSPHGHAAFFLDVP